MGIIILHLKKNTCLMTTLAIVLVSVITSVILSGLIFALVSKVYGLKNDLKIHKIEDDKEKDELKADIKTLEKQVDSVNLYHNDAHIRNIETDLATLKK